MAVPTHDATTITSTTFTSNQNPTVSHTRGASNSNHVAIISVSWNRSTTQAVLNTVTYGGSGATALHNPLHYAGASNQSLAMWIFKNPSSGASTVQANFDSVPNGGIIRVSTYYNVHQTTSTGAVATAIGVDNTATVGVASAVGELVVDAACTITGITLTVDGSQTERFNISLSGNHKMGGSEEAGAASSTTMSWDCAGGSVFWGIIGVALKPSSDDLTLGANLIVPSIMLGRRYV